MKKVTEKLKNNRFALFMLVLFVVGLFVGILYFFRLPLTTKNEILNSLNHVKDTSPYLSIINNQYILMIAIILMSFSVIGFPVVVFIFFYQALCLSFTGISFIYFFGLKGLLFFLIYFIIFNLIYYIVLFYLTSTAFKMTKILLDAVKKKVDLNLGDFLRKYFSKFILILSFLLIYNVLIYFFGSKLLKMFIFLI